MYVCVCVDSPGPERELDNVHRMQTSSLNLCFSKNNHRFASSRFPGELNLARQPSFIEIPKPVKGTPVSSKETPAQLENLAILLMPFLPPAILLTSLSGTQVSSFQRVLKISIISKVKCSYLPTIPHQPTPSTRQSDILALSTPMTSFPSIYRVVLRLYPISQRQ